MRESRVPESARGGRQRPRLVFSLFALAIGAAFVAFGVPGCRSRGAPADDMTGPLNAILITIDTLRADHVGAYGYARPTTPALDRLARNGIRFTRAVSVSSWTLPAHASLLTGLYPAEHGVQTDLTALPPSAFTLAEALQAAGYDTFAGVSHVYLSRQWRFAQGFRTFDESAARGAPQQPVAERVVDAAIAWLTRREQEPRGDAPFFMWLHIFDPHWDYAPPEPYRTMFDPDYAGELDGTYASIKPYIKALRSDPPAPPPARYLEHLIALYDGEIRYVDDNLARLFAVLEDRGYDRDTVVVVVSDHGEEFFEHGSLEGHQWTLYDEVVMVPWILYAPAGRCAVQKRAGHAIDRQVSTVTVPGTLLDCLEVRHDKRSVAHLLASERSGPRGATGLTGDPAPGVDEALLDLTVHRRARWLGLRIPEAKLIRSPLGRDELYERPATGEHDNVATRRPELAARLAARIDKMTSGLRPLADAGIGRRRLDEPTIERLRSTGYLR